MTKQQVLDAIQQLRAEDVPDVQKAVELRQLQDAVRRGAKDIEAGRYTRLATEADLSSFFQGIRERAQSRLGVTTRAGWPRFCGKMVFIQNG